MHRLALVLDPVAESREVLRPPVEHAVDDVGDLALPRARAAGPYAGESARSDTVSCLRPPQIERSVVVRLGRVDALADQVEERRRELVRARLAALAEQRRYERGRRVGRRLLLVLAVVAGSSLASEEPEHGEEDEERRNRRQQRARRARYEEGGPSARRSARCRARNARRPPAPRRGSRRGRFRGRRACLPVEENAERGMTVRSSTYWCAGTLTARSVACVPASSTSPRTHTGFPHARSISPGARSTATRRESGSAHWSPQTLRFTSTTSSYATATPRSVYEIVNARVWLLASKYQTMRIPSPWRVTPNVPRGPGERSVREPRRYAFPFSATEGFTSDSPSRSGMSRYPKWKSPEKAASIRSLTPSEPSFWTSTPTSAESSEKLVGPRGAGTASAAPRRGRATRARHDSGRERTASGASRSRAPTRAGLRSRPQKSTAGASRCASSPTSKNSRAVKPNGPARTTPGNVWIPLLYVSTVSL